MKRLILVCFCSVFYLAAHSQAVVSQSMRNMPLDTNVVIYDEQGNALRFYQYTKLLNTGEYTVTWDGVPGTPGVTRHIKKVGLQRNISMFKRLMINMAINSPMLRQDSLLDIKPLLGRIKKTELDQKIIVLIFWNTNCPLCTDSFSDINDFFDQLQAKNDVVIIAITRDDEYIVNEEMKQKPLKYAHFDNEASEIVNAYQLKDYPAYVVTDKNHVIRYATSGSSPITITMLKNSINQVLQ